MLNYIPTPHTILKRTHTNENSEYPCINNPILLTKYAVSHPKLGEIHIDWHQNFTNATPRFELSVLIVPTPHTGDSLSLSVKPPNKQHWNFASLTIFLCNFVVSRISQTKNGVFSMHAAAVTEHNHVSAWSIAIFYASRQKACFSPRIFEF